MSFAESVAHPPSRAAWLSRAWAPWLIGFLLWTGVATLFSLRQIYIYSTWDRPFTVPDLLRYAVLPTFIDAYAWALLTPPVVWLTRRLPFTGRRWLRALPAHLALATIVSAAVLAVDFQVARWLYRPEETKHMYFPRFFVANLPWNLQWYAIVAGITLMLDSYRRLRDRELRASQLETQLVRAQLQTLKMQIQPHFLFNTLHAISELVHENADAADRMISRLGDLLRISMDAGGRQEVPLREELEFLRAYLEIQQTRFQDRLSVQVEAPTELLGAQLPNLLLQPLVENAIRHGTAGDTGPVHIRVRALRQAGRLRLEVRDRGVGLPHGEGALREGVGIGNTRARLRQLYGRDHSLEIRNAPGGGVLAVVLLPLRMEPTEPLDEPALAGVAEEAV